MQKVDRLMTRQHLIAFAEEASKLKKRTKHLADIGQPVHSLAIELACAKAKDPLRRLLPREAKAE